MPFWYGNRVIPAIASALRRYALPLRLLAWGGIGYAAYLSAIHTRDYPPVLYQYDVTRIFFGWLLLLGPLALAWGGVRLPWSLRA